MLHHRAMDLVDLRLTRPPESMKTKQMIASKSMDNVLGRVNEGPQKSLSDISNEKSIPVKEKPQTAAAMASQAGHRSQQVSSRSAAGHTV